MTDHSDPIGAAQQAVKEARQLEDAGDPEGAEHFWTEAERLYAEAGVDETWFKDAALVGELDEPEPPMRAYWLYPTELVEMRYIDDDPPEKPSGVIAPVDCIVPVQE